MDTISDIIVTAVDNSKNAVVKIDCFKSDTT